MVEDLKPEDYDFMMVSLDDLPEFKVLPEDTEVEVEIENVEPHADKFYAQYSLRVLGQELVKSIRHPLFFPKPEDDLEKRANKGTRIKEFYRAFGITQGTVPADQIGKTAWVILKVESNEQYGDQNVVKRVIKKS